MENYKEFLNRINSFEKKETSFGDEYFNGNPSIAHKVNADNSFKEFYGDTVVFDLDENTKKFIAECVAKLYEVAPECFPERLINSTFHMTLHDLSNSKNLSDVAVELFYNELKVIDKIKTLDTRKIDVTSPINMKCKYIFNMVNTSLVMGLYPASEDDYSRLMELYNIFDDVKSLPYPLTPHITLAYYSIEGFDTESAGKLEQAILELNENISDVDVRLSINNLYYQKFRSMNDYINVINIGKNIGKRL